MNKEKEINFGSIILGAIICFVILLILNSCRGTMNVSNPIITPQVNLSSSTVSIAPVVNLSSGVKVADEIKGVDLAQAKVMDVRMENSTIIVSSGAVNVLVSVAVEKLEMPALPNKFLSGVLLGILIPCLLILIVIICVLFRSKTNKTPK